MIFALALVFGSCDNGAQLAEENLKVVEKYQAALKSLDYDTMKEILAEDYMGYGPSLGDSMNKEDALLNFKYNMENLYDKLKFRGIENVVVGNPTGVRPGQWISSWGRFEIKFKGQSNEAVIWANTIYLVNEGKITRSFIFYNEADALRQMGYSYVFSEPN